MGRANQNWNCSYIKKPHTWSVDEDQGNAGASGVRVHCTECPQVETLFAPYTHQYLVNSRNIAAGVVNSPTQKKAEENSK